MPPFFNQWCNVTDHKVGSHRVRVLTEKPGVRPSVTPSLDEAVLDNYDEVGRLERWAVQLGLPNAAAVLREIFPTEVRARSGHVGEVLLTESIPELFPGFIVPIKRLRWLDGRNMHLRGEDFIGIDNRAGHIRFLKAESKSRMSLKAKVVSEARAALNANGGRPSAHAMLFIAKRLEEIGESALSSIFLDYALKNQMQETQLVHLVFTLSGNDCTELLRNDLEAYAGTVQQQAVGLVISDHQDFILGIYTRLTDAAQH